MGKQQKLKHNPPGEVISPSLPVLCIVGLGNPGREYAGTRHNVGFWLIDELADLLQIKLRKAFFSHFAEAQFNVQDIPAEFSGYADELPRFSKIVLIKPWTFMNRSGKVIPHLLRKYGQNLKFAVAVDQLDRPTAALRVKKRGGTAGHNGLKSIVSYLDKDFWPMYIGIGRPEVKSDVISYVLAEPPEDELHALHDSIHRLARWILRLPFVDIDSHLQEINSEQSPEHA